jgi:phospholipid/cholesterol/gamma-HCH transport system substrate-binding protein
MTKVSSATDELGAAANSVATLSTNANGRVTTLGEELDTVLVEARNVVASANAVMAQGNETMSLVNGLLAGPATGAVEDSRMAAQDLRILISRLDRLARDIEQSPQSLLVGEPVPYEDKRK